MKNTKVYSKMKWSLFIVPVLWCLGCRPVTENKGSANAGHAISEEKAVYSPMDYMKWVESEDGLRIIKKIEKIEFQLQYTPKDYMAITDYKDSLAALTVNKLNDAVKAYEGLQYFKLRISIDEFNDEIVKYNIRNDVEYEDRVKYYSFNMQRRLTLIDGKDTLPCVMYNYERTFNLTPNSNFQIAFPATANTASKTLVIDDLYLGTGKVMIGLSEEKIKSIPEIAF